MMFTSCGYRFGERGILAQYKSVSVPYVEGDKNGTLTAAIAKELSSAGKDYKQSDGALTLKIKIMDSRDENIGFRYDRDNNNVILKDVVQSEGRVSIIIEVSVEETSTGKVLVGPKLMAASSDYDYAFSNSCDNMLQFSLGQIDTADVARDAAAESANRVLARKIVDYVNYMW